jgi:rod shape-determining protein MreC
MIRLSPARRAVVQRVTFPLLVFLSAAMIVLGKTNPVALESLSNFVMDAAAPLLDLLSRPTAVLDSAADRARGIATLYKENAKLAQENERLLGWQQAALKLASENAQLRDLLKLVPEPSASYVTARIIATSGGTYIRSLMVDAGRENGVVRGQAAFTGEGLIGRVTQVGSRAARILLITDLNSHIPVLVEGPRQRAILAGDNSERPNLRNLETGAAIRVGDRIVTSGQGGIFPSGLPVGIVAGFDGEAARVELYAELSRVDYVRLVDYGLADALPNPLPLAPRNGRRADGSAGGPPLRP